MFVAVNIHVMIFSITQQCNLVRILVRSSGTRCFHISNRSNSDSLHTTQEIVNLLADTEKAKAILSKIN